MENTNFSRAFRGIWISAVVWLNKELTLTEKCLCAEIDSLSNPDCIASNAHLAEFLSSTPESVAVMLSKLRKKGFVGENETDLEGRRVLRLAKGFNARLREGLTPVKGGVKHPLNKENSHESKGESKEADDAPPAEKKRTLRQALTAKEIADYVFPPSLETEDVHAAIEEWRAHLAKKRRSLTRSMLTHLLKDCLEWGNVNAPLYIRFCASKGWISVHPKPGALSTVGGTSAAERVKKDRATTYEMDRDKFNAINNAGLEKDLAEQPPTTPTNDKKSEYAED